MRSVFKTAFCIALISVGMMPVACTVKTLDEELACMDLFVRWKTKPAKLPETLRLYMVPEGNGLSFQKLQIPYKEESHLDVYPGDYYGVAVSGDVENIVYRGEREGIRNFRLTTAILDPDQYGDSTLASLSDSVFVGCGQMFFLRPGIENASTVTLKSDVKWCDITVEEVDNLLEVQRIDAVLSGMYSSFFPFDMMPGGDTVRMAAAMEFFPALRTATTNFYFFGYPELDSYYLKVNVVMRSRQVFTKTFDVSSQMLLYKDSSYVSLKVSGLPIPVK